MARCLFANNFIIPVLFSLLYIKETSPYEKIYLENSKLCTLRDHGDNTVVVLGKAEQSAKVVVSNKYFVRWSGKYAFLCEFLVKAPSQYGVYAVIQNLNFRKDPVSQTCIDFIEFEIPPRINIFFKKTEKVSKKFCGRLGPREAYLFDSKDVAYHEILSSSIVADNGFVAKDEMIHVKIQVAQQKLNPDEKLDIKIVFTAFKNDCKKKSKLFQCKECEWIWENFTSDNVQNCPYVSCLDENFCKNIDPKNEIQNIISSGTGTKVSIGAVATIILVLLMFACCVWVSRRMQLWCFNPTGSRQSRMEMNSTQTGTRFEENVSQYGDMLPDSTAPSAPPIPEDKDLPPSYSSLFPEK